MHFLGRENAALTGRCYVVSKLKALFIVSPASLAINLLQKIITDSFTNASAGELEEVPIILLLKGSANRSSIFKSDRYNSFKLNASSSEPSSTQKTPHPSIDRFTVSFIQLPFHVVIHMQSD